MSGEPSDEGFTYDGQLVFNGVHFTDVSDPSLEPNTIVDDLPPFEEGTAEDPGSGYKTLEVADLIASANGMGETLRSVANNLSSFRYLYEDWYESEADVDGERRIVKVPRVKDVDIYWDYPDYMFFRGQQQDSDATEEDIKEELDDQASLDTVTFDEDFLLWILYRYHADKELTSNLNTRLLTDCETTGEEDNYGGRNEVGDSANIAQSVPLLDGILRGKSLSTLEGDFRIYDNHVTAKVESRGRVHVKASKGDVKAADDLRRMALSLLFLSEFTELYQKWRDNMDNQDKYPPDSFFTDIYDECDRQGNHITYSIQPVRDEYQRKRSP